MTPQVAPAPDDRRAHLADLLLSARDGSREALHQIVAELTPLLWHVARAQGLDAAMCDDVVQTTWLSLLRNLDQIRSPEALRAWLVTVVRREARRVGGVGVRERPVAVDSLESVPDDGRPFDELLMEGERGTALWRAVRQLSQRCQELLRVVAFVERPDYESVAAALGMPRGSVGPTRGRCLAKLRNLLMSQPEWSTT
ncbi:RNA polymerase sigma factor [Rugosimonospora africana]|uniref:DNA-directed RNA polymerase sigma-70 factor n=1 Tax=Rugosimonospora africana TaxID=556532 RepID=A0A8J3QXL1_9ACTN|nr:sigma-70 family RNA polymerase sigma factor [Rugosimonospora africana]GIH17630.1 DNA-directed RNA polymerase sigma-70 factor [Rugosimonospora africana]